MISWAAFVAGGLLLTADIATPAYSQTESPAQLSWALVSEQDQIPLGKKAAIQAIDEFRDRLSLGIKNAPEAAWKDGRNGQALVIHLFNRGHSQPVRALLERQVDLGSWRSAIEALIAFAERAGDASELLNKIDAKALNPVIAAHFALTQAMSLRAEPLKALKKLSEAKLLYPGGFVDESASRREVELLLEIGQRANALRAATRYIWRLGTSLYADGVVNHLAETVIPDLATNIDGKAAIAAFLGELPVGLRIRVVLSIANRMLLKGKLDEVAFFVNTARAIASSGSQERKRADFIDTLASIFNSPSDASLSKLRAMKSEFSSPEDVVLIEVAMDLLIRTRGPIDATPDHTSAATPATEAANQTIKKAQAALESDRR